MLGTLSCLMQHRWFDPSLRIIFPIEGIFPLELTWVLTQFPQNSFRWEYKPRSSSWTHVFHRTDSKDPDIHVLDGWMRASKTHPACTIHKDRMWTASMDGLENGQVCKNLTQIGEPQRYSWGTQKNKKKSLRIQSRKWAYFIIPVSTMGSISC